MVRRQQPYWNRGEREASFPKGREGEREEGDRLMERGRYNVGNSQMGKGCITYGASKKRSLP